ncbi:hypothetical protein, partial [uncultured Faecalibaculum sp.]|uniref:hypothetical protein n=1 Tax=uncultured Faecalibaculum sp. TaxID=1729681 RepID=UPI00272B0B24
DPLLPTGTETVPGASDKTVKSTECKETQRETDIQNRVKVSTPESISPIQTSGRKQTKPFEKD